MSKSPSSYSQASTNINSARVIQLTNALKIGADSLIQQGEERLHSAMIYSAVFLVTMIYAWHEITQDSKKCSKTHWPYLCHTLHSLFTLSLLFYYTIYFFSLPTFSMLLVFSIPLSVL